MMMKTITFYISDYGYGHATRSVALIRELLRQEEHVRIVVCHSYAIRFLKDSLQDKRVSFREISTDVGYVLKHESILPDQMRLTKEYLSFIEDWEEKQSRERTFLKDQKVDLVVSDISPLPFPAAYELGIPSVGVSNFTWYTAYQGLVDNQLLDPFYHAYNKMTDFFSLASSQEVKWTESVNTYGFYSRETDRFEVQRIKSQLNPDGKKTIVFVGIGMKMDTSFLESLPLWESQDCVFVVSSNVDISRENVFKMPIEYLESQNFISASDLVITKAGWGTVSEAVTAKVPLLIIERESMQEDNNTTAYLQDRDLCQTIKWSDFKTLRLNQTTLNLFKNNPSLRTFRNESSDIARDILALI